MILMIYLHFLIVAKVLAKSGYFVPLKRHYDDNQYNTNLMVVKYDKSCVAANYSSNGRAIDKLLLSKYPCLESLDAHLVLYTFEITILNISDNSCLQSKLIDYDELCISNLEYDIYVTEDNLAVDNVNCIDRQLEKEMWNLEFEYGPDDAVLDDGTNGVYEYPILDAGASESNIDIYVIDTGIYKNHNEFSDSRIQANYEWFRWLGNIWETTALSWHGTLIAAVIIGKNVGVSDINDFKLYNVNLGFFNSLDLHEVQFLPGLTLLWIQVILNMQQRNAKRAIINCSFGNRESVDSSNDWDEFFKYVKEELNGIIVAAAGNKAINTCDTDEKFYPAASDYVIGVGSSKRDGSVNSQHNYGDCIDLFAPGTTIFSASILENIDPDTILETVINNFLGPFEEDKYVYADGTSLATAHITGLIASILMQQTQTVRMSASNEMIIAYLTSPGKYIELTNCQQNHCYAPLMQCNRSDFASFISTTQQPTQQPTQVPTSIRSNETNDVITISQKFVGYILLMLMLLVL